MDKCSTEDDTPEGGTTEDNTTEDDKIERVEKDETLETSVVDGLSESEVVTVVDDMVLTEYERLSEDLDTIAVDDGTNTEETERSVRELDITMELEDENEESNSEETLSVDDE